MKRLWMMAALLSMVCLSAQALGNVKSWQITSPDGRLAVTIQDLGENRTSWELRYDGSIVLAPSELDVTIDGQSLKGISKKVKEEAVNTSFATPFYKKAQVTDHYRRMVLRFKNGVDVEFRAYNDGAAYRFLVNKQAKQVDNEKAEFNFNQDYRAFIPYVNDNRGGERYCYSFESYYDEVRLSQMYADSLAITPLAVCEENGLKAIVMDAGVEDYPGMMLKKHGPYSLTAEFAPYLRMLCGPMDYTPGAMTNAMRDNFFGNNNHPMSQGTRVHQLAMYIAFEAPLQMLADAPTKYERNQECTDFIARIPTTFDETVVVDGQLGEYLVIARRKGTTWYVAAMTDWTPRQLTLPMTFLDSGQFRAVTLSDGINAAKDATDYQRREATFSSADTLTLQLSSGGGWAAIVNK